MTDAIVAERQGVLVVEDEPRLLLDAMSCVDAAGFAAYAARNADQAINLMEKHDDVRILFTDVRIYGGMDGLRLAHLVRDRWPNVRTIVTSGVRKIASAEMPPSSIFIAKPYAPETLVRTLTEMAARSYD